MARKQRCVLAMQINTTEDTPLIKDEKLFLKEYFVS